MAMFDQIASGTLPDHYRRCPVPHVRARLPEADQEQFDVVLADPSVAATDIAKTLTANGHPMAAAPLRNHRRGICRCPR